ncbi:poly [ADP-ribose] polymerase tankyrase-like [Sycon ciliatum]|uniref:poly [ADP-ribose] polymerase tankyrase-like n=1 Tax=Sycon ciliatum TaxID=27933 RepID=UPI0031F64759
MSSTTSSLDSSNEECRSPFSGVARPSMVGDAATGTVQQTGSSDDNLFEACKNGDLKRVKELVSSSNVNLQDTTGRRSTPLHFAAGYGRKEIVGHLLDCGADVMARDDGGLIPLHNASSFGHADVVTMLVEAKANPNARDNWNFTPLHEAASKGKVEVCIVLLQNGADATICNSDGKTPLDLADVQARLILTGEFKKDEFLEAARSGREDILMSFVTPIIVNCHASDGRKSTALHLAAGYNRVHCVQLLLQHGADVHAKDKGGLVPLHNACSYGHYEVTELLLKHGASVNAMDLWQFTPLHEAASKGRQEVCSLLLAHGADPTLANCHSKSPLHVALTSDLQVQMHTEFRGHQFLEACRQGDMSRVKKLLNLETMAFSDPLTLNTGVHCVAASSVARRKALLELLLKKGADVNAANREMSTPLHLSCHRGYVDAMEVLIKYNCKINMPDNLGLTPLHRAAQANELQACRLLISHDADVSLTNNDGQTASQMATEEFVKKLLEDDQPTIGSEQDNQLLEAAKNGDMETIKSLLTSSNVNCRDIDGRMSTPLHFASGYNRIPVVEHLLQNGANVHAKDKGGLVPLHNACSYGHYEVAELLVKHGANVNMPDLWKFTPLHEAAAKGKFDICRLLIQNGADAGKKNRDNQTPLDLVKETDVDIKDLLRGDGAILELSRKGEVGRLACVLTKDNVNCRDSSGRNSTPLHLAAGYNQIEVADLLLTNGADANAKDKGGLIPLHNASSYGHAEIAALLINHGSIVNAVDRWGFTPLHEAAQKGRTQLCALLILHGADVHLRNQEGQSPFDVSTQDDVRVLISAAMQQLNVHTPVDASSTGAVDGGAATQPATSVATSGVPTTGGPSAGTCSMQLQTQIGRDIGMSPFVTALLGSPGPAAAALGRSPAGAAAATASTAASSVVTAAIPTSVISTTAVSAPLVQTTASTGVSAAATASGNTLGAATAMDLSRSSSVDQIKREELEGQEYADGVPGRVAGPTRSDHSEGDISTAAGDAAGTNGDVAKFLSDLHLSHLLPILQREAITMDVLVDMGHEELKEIGIAAYGNRHKIVRAMKDYASGATGTAAACSSPVNAAATDSRAASAAPSSQGQATADASTTASIGVRSAQAGVGSNVAGMQPSVGVGSAASASAAHTSGTQLMDLSRQDKDYVSVVEEMQTTIREHRDQAVGGLFSSYDIVKVQRVYNKRLWERYIYRRQEVADENHGHYNERMLFHGSPFIGNILQNGFDERHAYIGGMFGAGIYFAQNSSKSNQYVYGIGGGSGCTKHKDRSCYVCSRQMVLCRVTLGNAYLQRSAIKMAHAPPGHHSVIGQPSSGGLAFAEYVIYRGEQAYPEYLITYKIANPASANASPQHHSA